MAKGCGWDLNARAISLFVQLTKHSNVLAGMVAVEMATKDVPGGKITFDEFKVYIRSLTTITFYAGLLKSFSISHK